MAASASSMGPLAEAFVLIRADRSQFKRDLSEIENDVDDSTGRIRTSFEKMRDVAGGILAAMGINSLIGGLQQLGQAFISTNDKLERYRLSLGVMIKDQDRADVMIKDVQAFASKTPFSTDTLMSSVQLLKTFQFETGKILPMLKNIGDAAAASPMGMQEGVQRISLALGQMRAAGKVLGQDVMQLVQAGVPVWDILREKSGKTMEQLKKDVHSGVIDADKAIAMILEGLNDRFGGMMDKQSQTWEGLRSTLEDNAAIITQKISKPLFDVAKLNLSRLVKFLESPAAAEWVKFLQDGMKSLVSLGQKIGETVMWIAQNPVVQMVAKWGAIVLAASAVEALLAPVAGTIAAAAAAAAPLVAAFVALEAAVAYVAAQWNALLASPAGKQVAKDLREVYDLAREIGRSFVDQIGPALAELGAAALAFLEPWTGAAGNGVQGFIATLVAGLRQLLDMVSLLMTNWKATWEIMKTSAAVSLSSSADNMSHFWTNLQRLGVATVAGMGALVNTFVERWQQGFEIILSNFTLLGRAIADGMTTAVQTGSFEEGGKAAMAVFRAEFRKLSKEGAIYGKAFTDTFKQSLEQQGGLAGGDSAATSELRKQLDSQVAALAAKREAIRKAVGQAAVVDFFKSTSESYASAFRSLIMGVTKEAKAQFGGLMETADKFGEKTKVWMAANDGLKILKGVGIDKKALDAIKAKDQKEKDEEAGINAVAKEMGIDPKNLKEHFDRMKKKKSDFVGAADFNKSIQQKLNNDPLQKAMLDLQKKQAKNGEDALKPLHKIAESVDGIKKLFGVGA